MAHLDDPTSFNWKTVDVRWLKCDGAIRVPKFVADEELSKDQRELLSERRNLGRKDLVALRPKVQAIFEAHDEPPPPAFRPAMTRLENSDDGRLVSIVAQQFCDRVTKRVTDEATVREFMSVCPPFRALVYSTFVPWYNTAVRDYRAGEKLDAGHNDLFMSVYLPYCDWFVTNDEGQEKSLREVAAHAGPETKILTYDTFCDKLLVAV